MSSTTVATLIAQLEPVVDELGLDLDDLSLSKSGKYRVLEIALDGDAVDLDLIASASRKISEFLDENNLMGEQPYTLEVTTRGIDRPLTKPSHWQRNIGRLVKFSATQKSGVGRITAFTNPKVTLQTDKEIIELDLSEISNAIVQVEFKKLSDKD